MSGDFTFGPRREGGGTRLRLWAPDAAAVSAVIDAAASVKMTPTRGGWWEALTDAQPGARYAFQIDDKHWPDPASRFQPDDVRGPSLLVDETAYTWRNTQWCGRPFEEAVIYEAHLGVLGGYDGLRARLPSLAELGVTAVQLMPINDFPGARNWGYDGVLPYAPDSAYGDRDGLKHLIDEAHGLGLMVFLDVVYNHFGPEGNGLPAYASGFFDEAEQTPWGAAVAFKNPVVRRFFTENVLYWLEVFRFDGMRFDAVHAIEDQSWLPEMAAEVRARWPDRRVHLILENEGNTASLLEKSFDAQWNDDFHNVLHVLLTGETHGYYAGFACDAISRLARCLGEGFVYQGETPPGHGRPRGEPSGELRATAFVAFLQNHDQVGNRAFGERLIQLARPKALRAAMALLLLSPQIPMLFMGEEVGAREPFLFFTDFHGELAAAVREGRRREFQGAPGFSNEAEREKIPDPNAISTFETSVWTEKDPDAGAWRKLVTELLGLRRAHVIPRLRNAVPLGAEAIGPTAVLARWGLSDGATLTLAVNLGGEAVEADLPQAQPFFGMLEPDGRLPPETTSAWLFA